MSEPIVITRTLSAPPQRVFDAWTTPADFSVWFGTAAVDVPLETLSMDVREGGQLRAVMHLPDGTTIDWAGEYTEVASPTRLAFTLTDVPSEPAGEPLTVDFRAVEGGTEVTLVQISPGFSAEQRDATIAGYGGFFDAMEQVVAD